MLEAGTANDFTATPMTWTVRTAGNVLRGIAWSGTVLAAAGDETTLTSPDGAAWTGRTSDSASEVLWTGTQFAAASGNRMLTSPDGVTWTPHPTGAVTALYGIAWSGIRYVLVGESPAPGYGVINVTKKVTNSTDIKTTFPFHGNLSYINTPVPGYFTLTANQSVSFTRASGSSWEMTEDVPGGWKIVSAHVSFGV